MCYIFILTKEKSHGTFETAHYQHQLYSLRLLRIEYLVHCLISNQCPF